jgi:RNA polymerase sigma-70 factor (ECF subfamily)
MASSFLIAVNATCLCGLDVARVPGLQCTRRSQGATMPSEFRNELLSLVPSLRAFAFCLTQDQSEADDLAYGSLIEIWSKHRLRRGTELKVAAFTVVDRHYQKRNPANPLSTHTAKASRAGSQERLFAIFESLGRDEREALSLVVVWGFTNDQAARICDIDMRTLGLRVTNAYLSLVPGLPLRTHADKSDRVNIRHKRTKERCHG